MTKARLGIERLEDRDVPALFGVPWVDSTHLTLSFAPDGTSIAGTANNLQASLGANFTAFRNTILRAAQTWAAQANISISVVGDNGSAFGTAGATQHDPRFGDIRVGGRAFGLSAAAVAVPPDPFLSGTWAGDIVFNTRIDWSKPSSKTFNVALHEIGHALGLDENNDPTSALVKNLKLAPPALSANDITAIRALYGAPAPDQYEGSNGNSTFSRASGLNESDDEPTFAFANLSSNQDVDFYRYQPPGGDDAGPTTVRVVTNGLSLLQAQVSVYTEAGQLVTQGTVDSMSGALSLTFNAAESGKFFIKVSNGSSGVFGAGRYSLAITPNALGVPANTLDEFLRGPYELLSPSEVEHAWEDPANVLVNDDGTDDEGEDGALDLSPVRAGRLFTVGSLNGPADADYYRVTAPRNGTITAAVTSFGPNGIVPQLELYNQAGQRVAADVVANGTGGFAIQANGLVANSPYVVRAVSATGESGNYQVVVETKAVGPLVSSQAGRRLSAATPTKSYKFFVAQNALFHFALTAGPESGVRMTVRDRAGAVVFQLNAAAGQTASVAPTLFIPGAYLVQFTATDQLGTNIVSFKLRGASISDPVGPTLVNPATTPQYVAPTPPQPNLTYLYPGQVYSAVPFLWVLKTL